MFMVQTHTEREGNMIGSIKRHAFWSCPAITALFLFSGCVAGQQGAVVSDQGSYVEYKYDSEADAKKYMAGSQENEVSYVDDSKQQEIQYVTKGDELVRVTPVKAHELKASRTEEVLSPLDAEFKAAVSRQQLEDFIAKNAPDELAFVAVQRLARPYIDARNWPAAAAVFNSYSDKFPNKEYQIFSIVGTLEDREEGLRITNLGGGINTSEAEYNPVVASNGKKIYFARDCGICNGGEEVYVSTLLDNGNWSLARRFGEPLASKGHEIPLGVSSDGNKLAVYGNYDGSLGRGDLFYVEKTSNGWGALQQFPMPMNSEYFESNAMYAADGSAMLFISERPGGVGEFHKKGEYFHGSYSGNTDIYVYTDGQAINLGNAINTPYSEYSPFLHPDGMTLYFSSDGHPGLGGLDVFVSKRLNADSWTEWSDPVNLGKEINTSNDDWGYQVAARADKAYFAVSDRGDSYGASDIFSISMSVKGKPALGVITVSGLVTDPNFDPLVADIRWNDLEAQKQVGYASSDPITGEYVIHLPSGGKYGYYAEKEGYMGESEHFDLKHTDQYKEYEMDIVLYPIEKPVDETEDAPVVAVEIKMNNIFFAFNKSDLRPESRMELDRWVDMLNENTHINLEVAGHADSIGTEVYNQKLSERRARSVAKYLVAAGIAKERLTPLGYGETRPVSSNMTEDGRQQNRRVQVKMINSTRH
jgi:outer membrane protein OmpA-like peptidoglycan-associated protein